MPRQKIVAYALILCMALSRRIGLTGGERIGVNGQSTNHEGHIQTPVS